MILVLDNYDSFTYNLVHLVGAETAEFHVVRNDDLTVDDVREMAAKADMPMPKVAFIPHAAPNAFATGRRS